MAKKYIHAYIHTANREIGSAKVTRNNWKFEDRRHLYYENKKSECLKLREQKRSQKIEGTRNMKSCRLK